LIHVDGPWGSGKSTLLDYVADELGDQQSPKNEPWLIVRYDAWRQTRVGPPWWTLLTQLHDALKSGLPRRRRLRLWSSRMVTRIQTAGLLYLLVLAIAVALFILIGPDQVTAYLTAVSALVAGALAVGRFFLWDSAQGARIFENMQTNPMESLSDQFALLINRSPSPVVFLVDELDRCGSEQVVDLLDSIQTLVRDAPRKRDERRSARTPGVHTAPYFVIAADGAWIRRSYELAHERMTEAVAEPGRPLGHLFLAKIFQLTVKMPTLSPELRAIYFSSLLRGAHPDGEAQVPEQAPTAEQELGRATSEDEVLGVMKRASPEARQALAPLAVERLNAERVERETEEHVLDKFGELLEPNPRAIKRVVIAYGIERSVRTLEGSLVSRDTLMLWIILNTRWPGLGEYLAERPDAIDALGDGSVPKDVPPELAPLFQADAVSEVVRFSPGGPLTKALVADAAGISLEEPRRAHPARPVTGRGAS
jgi:KAP family P-loop domain